ncbi:NAD-dependent epimerase/dehydratase family protein [Micromonospora sp. BRA006-A]|nr:NAD-dependent epimerase/dehydratase family protein [Micromonospora sp. BRA006-A]
MSRVAVMGASGCVGRQVCAAFAHAGHPVVAVSRRPASHLAAYRFRSLDLASVPRSGSPAYSTRSGATSSST